MVVGHHLEPVVNAAHDDFRGEDIGDRAVLEHHVSGGEVLHIVVVGAQKAAIDETGQAGDAVRAGADRCGPDRPAITRTSLDPLEIERGSERVDALADEGAATIEPPKAVGLAVRAGVGFLAVHPEHLGARLLDDLALLLDGRRIHPVLGIEDHGVGLRFGIEHAVDAGQRAVERRLHGEC